MANLYFDEALARTFAGELLTVSGDEGRHAVRVSRLRVGEQTIVGNGRGLRAHGTVEAVDRDSFSVRVERSEEQAAPERRIVLVQALAKGDRDERAVEQATEFGVDAIIPWQAERSVSRWGNDKASKGVAKWARIAREASKQSMRAWIPEVLSPATTAELAALDGHVLVLHPRGATKLSAWLPDDGRDVYLVVGPEGGLSDAELAALAGQTDGETAARDGRIVLLGDDVLRTSSAGPAALAVLNAALGRW
ncbi:16S rRNA (uracil(1498)-N(3))-methyltransferase [Leucobacter komagatae]|uniref:Ribosomal RNA small subunit methyltransferase E n=1 Tax=Leucobacter komagatae TaxID=55969 RepID=A0A0D0IRJ6_9MICO|nr:16S rRNA (uracil(1498)-N(3))-methyltransferase [Leucobacter komagatae]KIP52048.1 16S rRNA methyltransferase [Leucobacter komagatae]